MVIFIVNISRYLQYFDTLMCSHHRHLSLTHILSLSLQWSYGFYLIHLQGKQGFQFFCKTEETKRKWMEQFDMAMWVWLHTPSIKRRATIYHILWVELKHDLDDLISKYSLLFTSRSNIKPERATANQHNFQMHTFEKNTNCRACKMLLR